ncbi:general amino-acid permease GAP1 [Cordyceps fumosorosea ARSEF 2679]|uniref:General amino-acid permease GAP1 n=1 Tax=Cordyceps fumosorosea (strain ARSEF 2679) TaxID=1081104 RepID=A0A167R0P3_CORFA|nr:general amino-acid permease GAP1 [Cordyceps fumosorosea ARSEF 2679]OAA58163.1 general amino-acid permease GAP1 [Cordyceps fumosorosea ARSEF 2679]
MDDHRWSKDGGGGPTGYLLQPAMGDEPPTRVQRFFQGFRRDPQSEFYRGNVDADADTIVRSHGVGPHYDLRSATVDNAQQGGLMRSLKGRHLQMIAIGGSVGAGLFVASGKALAVGGPASLLIAFSVVGIMLFCTCQALGELAVVFPIAGSFSSWSTRFLDPSWGFAMGWNYAIQWLGVLPLEIIAAALTIEYWNASIPRAVFVTIFLVVIITINMFGVKGYGEAEYAFSMIKVIAILGFILLGIVLNIGGTPDSGYIGGEYWHDPGAFHNGFKGICSVFTTAAFAFAGTELVGLAAAETAAPRKSLPTAIKQVFWRITLFYVIALTLVGLLVPYNSPRLYGGDNPVDASASPFVIAIEDAGIQVLPSVMNAVILVAILSVGNSAVFGSTRTLAAMANLRQAPRILGYVDRKGRPLVAIALAAAVGLLAYLADLRQQQVVLEWLLTASGLSTIFTWGSICMCHVRFRRAWAARGHSPEELPFQAQFGVAGSYVGLALNGLVITTQFWVGVSPVNSQNMTARQIVQNFFLKWMGAPVVLLFFLGHKFYYKTSYVRIENLDMDTGRREFNLPILIAQEKEERDSWPRWKHFYKVIC